MNYSKKHILWRTVKIAPVRDVACVDFRLFRQSLSMVSGWKWSWISETATKWEKVEHLALFSVGSVVSVTVIYPIHLNWFYTTQNMHWTPMSEPVKEMKMDVKMANCLMSVLGVYPVCIHAYVYFLYFLFLQYLSMETEFGSIDQSYFQLLCLMLSSIVSWNDWFQSQI